MTERELQEEVAYWERVAAQWRDRVPDARTGTRSVALTRRAYDAYAANALENATRYLRGWVNGWLCDSQVCSRSKYRKR